MDFAEEHVHELQVQTEEFSQKPERKHREIEAEKRTRHHRRWIQVFRTSNKDQVKMGETMEDVTLQLDRVCSVSGRMTEKGKSLKGN